MIAAYFGDDRVRIQNIINKQRDKLQAEYLVIDAETVTRADFLEHLQSGSLFAETELIVIKDLARRSDLHEAFLGLVASLKESQQKLVLLIDEKWDKRSLIYKNLSQTIKFTEYSRPVLDDKLVFGVLDLALAKNHPKLLTTLEKIKHTTEPAVFMAVIGSQLAQYDRYKMKLPGEKYAKTAQSALKTDRLIKTAGLEPWMVITSWLLQLAS